MSYVVIREQCLGDQVCATVCPVDCITYPDELGGTARFDADECIGCDACIEVCPAEAIEASGNSH